MDAIRLVEGCHAPDPIEQKGNEGRLALSGDLRENRGKLGHVFGSKVCRQFHPDHQDFNRRVPGPDFLDDLQKVLPGAVRCQTP